MPTSMALRLSFNLSGIDPNAPTTTGMTFVFTPHIFIIIFIIIIIIISFYNNFYFLHLE